LGVGQINFAGFASIAANLHDGNGILMTKKVAQMSQIVFPESFECANFHPSNQLLLQQLRYSTTDHHCLFNH
jgi:hypothetical protein